MALDLQQVHQEMLDRIDNRYQKTVGFPAYDFTRAFALAVLSLDGDISIAEANLRIENMTGQWLDDYILQHSGLVRKYGTYATTNLRVVTGAGEIRAGDLFSTLSGVEFYATTDGYYEEGDTFPVRAYLAGESGNVEAGTITFFPVTIAGIAAVTNDAPAAGGYGTESDDDFRDRFLDYLQNPNNGGNQNAYIQWAMSVAGVGRVRVFPQALGKNTVEVCIVDTAMGPATEDLIGTVQNLIDPNKNGDGAGKAPIGAMCTVTTATSFPIAVAAKLRIADDYDFEAVSGDVTQALAEYILDVAFRNETTYLSYSQMATKINSVQGVLDHSDLLLNGAPENVTLEDRQTPILGETNFTEQAVGE